MRLTVDASRRAERTNRVVRIARRRQSRAARPTRAAPADRAPARRRSTRVSSNTWTARQVDAQRRAGRLRPARTAPSRARPRSDRACSAGARRRADRRARPRTTLMPGSNSIGRRALDRRIARRRARPSAVARLAREQRRALDGDALRQQDGVAVGARPRRVTISSRAASPSIAPTTIGRSMPDRDLGVAADQLDAERCAGVVELVEDRAGQRRPARRAAAARSPGTTRAARPCTRCRSR